MEAKNFKSAACWILLSPLLFIMASISTVESITTYYIQLVIFSIVTLVGLSVGVGYISGSSLAPKVAKYTLWLIGIYFVGSWVLILLILAWQFLIGAL